VIASSANPSDPLSKKSARRNDESMLRKYFFAGLVTLLPLAVTLMTILFVVNWLTKPFIGIVERLLDFLPIHSESVIRWISQILILLFLFFFTLCLGLLARRYFFTTLIKMGEKALNRIPFIKTIYKTAREFFHTLLKGGKVTFQQVVMVPFPNEDSYVLGLISQEAPKACNPQAEGESLISIFIPATPNPLSGFLIVRPRTGLIYLDMKSEDAIKYVVSCGVVPPNPLPGKP
jgi:uncharacterized membrane protein